MMQNELALRSKEQIDAGFARIWQVMATGIERGMNTEGVLPGPLNVPRRAVALRRLLVSSDNLSRDPMNVIDWINMFARRERRERGGRASGHRADQRRVRHYSAVLAYYDKFRRPVNANSIARYLLSAGRLACCTR